MDTFIFGPKVECSFFFFGPFTLHCPSDIHFAGFPYLQHAVSLNCLASIFSGRMKPKCINIHPHFLLSPLCGRHFAIMQLKTWKAQVVWWGKCGLLEEKWPEDSCWMLRCVNASAFALVMKTGESSPCGHKLSAQPNTALHNTAAKLWHLICFAEI